MKKRISWVQLVVVLGLGVGCCSAATFDPDSLYVSSGSLAAGTGTVDRFDISGANGAFQESVTPGLTATPTGSAFAPDGKLWAAVGTSIIRFDESGILDNISTGAGGPEELLFGPDGNAYLVDRYGDVTKYDGATGASLGVFIDYRNTVPGVNPLAVNAVGLVFAEDPNNPEVYQAYLSVSEGDYFNTIERFDATTGAYIDRFLTLPSELLLPAGMAFGRETKFFVACYYANKVLRYDVTAGDGPAEFEYGGINRPWDVQLGPDESLYVTSRLDGAVVRFDINDARTNDYISGLTDPTFMTIPQLVGPGQCGDLWHPYLVGDTSEDCRVNLADISILANHWMECTHPDCD